MTINVSDQNQLVPTSNYPYAKFNFEHFNPVQSRVFEAYDKDCNYFVAAQTSVGKTICSELFLAQEVRKNNKKGLYLSPFRALSQERIDDWKSNHFKDLNIAICTGDYKLNASRKKELEEANLIIMTTEILNSKARNYNPDNDTFLKDIGTVCVDEFHLIADESRGIHAESAIMQFTKINPDARLILLSDTAPNARELGTWIERLNKKQTYVLESTYRPCPLVVHYLKYEDYGSYDANEESKVSNAIRVVENYPKDKFILFVHTKRTGELLLSTLKKIGISCEYHNADLDKEKRIKVETKFKEDPNLRVIVATSTLSTGVNLPARRSVLLGCHMGLKEVNSRSLWQAMGRTGRPQYDPQGDAYLLLPQRSFEKHKARIETPENVLSRMLEKKALAFHIVSEISHGSIRTSEDIHEWYTRSLAYWQNQFLEDEDIDEVIKSLTRCGAIVKNEDIYETTKVGLVSSMFYYSPFDISDLYRNWNGIFKQKRQNDDYAVSMALGNTDSYRPSIVSNADREEIKQFKNKVVGDFTEGAMKMGCCYFNLLKGKTPPILANIMRGLVADLERMIEVLCSLDKMAGCWGQSNYFRTLHLRLLYGVESEKVNLIKLKGIGKVKCDRLWSANLKDLEDIAMYPDKVAKALNCNEKIANKISENARELLEMS